MDDKDRDQPPDESRRRLLFGAAGLAAGVAVRHWLGNFGQPETPSVPPTPPPQPAPVLAERPLPPQPEKLTDELLLNQILELGPYSPERIAKEAEYLGRVETVEQIDRGFWVMTSKDLRGVLLHKRFQLREKGVLPISITSEEIKWAKSQGIHPETLAICKDAFLKAKEVLKKLYPNDSDIELRMINPGGMAKLMTEETGRALGGSDVSYAFNYAGEQAAEKHINPAVFPKDQAALIELCAKLSVDTSLKFNPKKVAGSYRGSQLSGGAIGAQFMPSTALEIYGDMEKVGEKFNPFDPQSAVIGAWVYLAKLGYRRGDLKSIEDAVGGWNGDPNEIKRVVKAALDFSDKFPPTPLLAMNRP